MIIYIVKKHLKIRGGWFADSYETAFVIHSTHYTKSEASLEAKKKNKKAQKYLYIVGKIEVEEDV